MASRAPLRTFAAVAACALAATVLLPAGAVGDLVNEEQLGRTTAESVQAGERDCSQLSTGEFELIGEYAMGRYLRDSAAHQVMNARMAAVMGEAAERRMHVALGHRYSGCRGGPAAGWMGPMAAMMFGRGYGEHGPWAGMMAGAGHDGDHSDGPPTAVLIAMAAVLVAAIGVAALWLRRRDARR